MLPQNKPDRIRILFDDHRLVANAGLLLPATLARHLGLRELVDHHLDLGGAPGRANTGDKMLTLVASALAGGDCIDDADENGAWFDYTFTNPATDSVETKHSWMVIHNGVTFGSGWYEEGVPACGWIRQATSMAMTCWGLPKPGVGWST